MIFSKDKLLELNYRGIIPGPNESSESFEQRVNSIRHPRFFEQYKDHQILSWHEFDWAKSTLAQLFDISPDWAVAYYSNKGLSFWQGAVAYISSGKKPFVALQIRKQLKGGKYLFLYEKDEILSHELAHAARMAFNEEKTEELFAYWTSASSIRKLFGPIFRSPFESNFFIAFSCLSFITQTFFPHLILAQLFPLASLLMLSYYLFRLFRTRLKVNCSLKKLTSILKSKSKARATLFRLTDKEIYFFAKSSLKEILHYIKKQNKKELRWKVICFAYFS